MYYFVFFLAGSLITAVGALIAMMYLTGRFRGAIDSRQRTHAQRYQQLSQLTSGLAHEIKNPLSTIKINLQLIAEQLDGGDEQSARALRKISVVQKETDRLENILETFLRYIGKLELVRVRADINELIRDMVDFYSPHAHSHNIKTRLGLSEQSLYCKVDITMIKQVILNLFLNAQQAMDAEGELIIRTSRNDGSCVIEISDTGRGIEPKNLEHIFEAYYTSRPGGSGLGLAMAKKIIEAHGGNISVSSQPGQGSSFIIELPAEAKIAE